MVVLLFVLQVSETICISVTVIVRCTRLVFVDVAESCVVAELASELLLVVLLLVLVVELDMVPVTRTVCPTCCLRSCVEISSMACGRVDCEPDGSLLCALD